MVGGGCQHSRVGSAAGTAGGNEIVHAAGQIAQQDVVLDEARRVFLVHQAAGGVSGVIGVALGIGIRALLAPVAAGDVDVALRRVG